MKTPLVIEEPLRAVARRIRLQRALNVAALAFVAGLGGGALVIVLLKTGTIPPSHAIGWLIALGAIPVVAFTVGVALPVARLLPAQLLDRSHALKSRLANAVDFASVPDGMRSEFMTAAIDDAARHARAVAPKRAMPFRVPPEFYVSVGLALGVALLAAMEVPQRVPVARTTELEPLLLHEDDIDAFETALEQLVNDPQTTDELRNMANQLNQVLEDLADRRLDRTEALRRISALEKRAAEGRNVDAESLRESLRELGQELTRSTMTREAAEALRDGDAARAEARMRELSDQLRREAPSKAELQRLRDALQRAATKQRPDRTQELQRQREEMRRLLQKQQNQPPNQRDRRLLDRRRRELERLEREQQQAQEQRRQLERLQREMQRAAEDLNRNQRENAADDLQRGAEDLNRMAQQQMSDEQMRQLEQQLRQLREQLSRQRQQQAQNGQGGQGQGQQGQSRMQRFVLRARGQGGDGQGVTLRMPGQGGQQGSGGQGQQGGQQQGQQGQQSKNQTLTLGQGGNAQLELPGMGQRQGQSQGQSQQGQGQRPGPGAGSDHDPNMLGDPTRLSGSTRDVRVEGEQGQGPSRSEVILSAADRGFASRDYERVFVDYQNHAEQALETDEIPPGYRFYVRRYFQLIRPREETPQ